MVGSYGTPEAFHVKSGVEAEHHDQGYNPRIQQLTHIIEGTIHPIDECQARCRDA